MNTIPDQQQNITTLQNLPNLSDTTPIQNVQNISELSNVTMNNPQSFTITSDSNASQSPKHNLTQNTNNDPNQNITNNNPNRDNTPQQSSSNSNGPDTIQVQLAVQFQITTLTRQPILQILTYTPAENTQTQNIQPGLTINTLHSNTLSNHTTSRNLSSPPLQIIPTNPLSYSLTSTNLISTQQATTSNNQLNILNHFSISQSNMSRKILQNTRFQTSNNPSTTIRTDPHINTTYAQPFTNIQNIPPNQLNTPTYDTVPPSTLPNATVSNPTHINSSTSIPEPIKPFDGLDHKYTPEKYLQHIEARVTFSLGLQLISYHEYRFWHARRMALIQRSLTGTALSWYIRLNDTYKQ